MFVEMLREFTCFPAEDLRELMAVIQPPKEQASEDREIFLWNAAIEWCTRHTLPSKAEMVTPPQMNSLPCSVSSPEMCETGKKESLPEVSPTTSTWPLPEEQVLAPAGVMMIQPRGTEPSADATEMVARPNSKMANPEQNVSSVRVQMSESPVELIKSKDGDEWSPRTRLKVDPADGWATHGSGADEVDSPRISANDVSERAREPPPRRRQVPSEMAGANRRAVRWRPGTTQQPTSPQTAWKVERLLKPRGGSKGL